MPILLSWWLFDAADALALTICQIHAGRPGHEAEE
jgi:Holliday junction resolvasome RuvABC endonuclease subunit